MKRNGIHTTYAQWEAQLKRELKSIQYPHSFQAFKDELRSPTQSGDEALREGWQAGEDPYRFMQAHGEEMGSSHNPRYNSRRNPGTWKPTHWVPAPQSASTADRRITRELQELIDYNYNMTSEAAAWEWARDNAVTESSEALTYAYQAAKAAWEMVTDTVLTGGRPEWVNKRLAARNNPGVVQVPIEWVNAATDWYEAAMAGGPKSIKVQVPLDTFPYPQLVPTLKKLYGKDTFGLKLHAGKLPPGVGGDTAYPGAGRSITIRIASGIKRPRNTIRHELRHGIQHLGDMALRAEAGKTKKEMRGRFGRPKKRTVASLRGRKAQAKAGKTTMTSTEWYLGSPSEFLPHVGDAAAWVVRKLPAEPTNKQVRAQIREAVKRRSIFQALTPRDRENAISSLYTEVYRMLGA